MTINTNGENPEASEHSSAAWPLMALLVVAAAVLVAIQWRRPRAPDPFVGLALPPIEAGGWLNTDRPLSADDLRGKVVLVDFWATNCHVCASHTPELVALHHKFRDHGLTLVGLTPESEAELEHVKRYVERAKIDWPIGYGAGFAFEMMGITGTPTYLLYDRSGRSVWGGHSLHGLEDAAVAALAK
ncbi:MAG: redoxin domain-containing protein [Planctomycetes bacterium]|nr:redoxin domain-containing protein [Planctomycetota bacterium]